jgi:hypothetical protein
MAERKTIGTVSVITDSDTSYDNIGDIDGGFSESELKEHIKKFGHQGLCEKLTAMSSQVWNMVREINMEADKNTPNKASQ